MEKERKFAGVNDKMEIPKSYIKQNATGEKIRI